MVTRRSGDVKKMFEREDAHYRRDPETGRYDVRQGKKIIRVGLSLSDAAALCRELNGEGKPPPGRGPGNNNTRYTEAA